MTKSHSIYRTFVLLSPRKESAMRLLRLAIEKQRWDLAAHTIVLATAKLLNNETIKPDKQSGEKTNATPGKKTSNQRKNK